MIMGMETKGMTGVFMVQDNKIIPKSNISMRLFGSTGEPNGHGDKIWDGGLIVSLFNRFGKSERPSNLIRMWKVKEGLRRDEGSGSKKNQLRN